VADLVLGVAPPTFQPDKPFPWWALTAALTLGAIATMWWTRHRSLVRVDKIVKPLNVDQLVAISYPDRVKVHRGLPNVEKPIPRDIEPPARKVPHVPTVCKTCGVADVRMDPTGNCLIEVADRRLSGGGTEIELESLLAWCKEQAEEPRAKRNMGYQLRWTQMIEKINLEIEKLRVA
jgi:hypothetical protein